MSLLSRRQLLAQTTAGAIAGLVAPRAFAAEPEFRSEWQFGDVRITKILDVVEPFDAARAFPGAPLEEFARNADWLPSYYYDATRKSIVFSFHSYLLRTRRLTMIVDTCFGEDTPLRPRQHHGQWLTNLAAAGVSPEEIDVVTCTHFHTDHVGWNTRLRDGRWVPTFPNARYLFNRAEVQELEALTKSGKAIGKAWEQSVKPVLDQARVRLLTKTVDVAHGIRIVPSPGHTAGHHSIEIHSKGRRAVLAGDILHSPIEVLHPEWINLFDNDKQAGIASRREFLDSYTDQDVTVFAAHFAGPTGGHIVSDARGRIFRGVS